MSKKKYDKVEIVLPNTNIKVKYTPAIWNIKADEKGFITIENIKKNYGSKITDIKPTSIKEVRVNDTTKFIIEGKGQTDEIKDKDMFFIYEWFEDKFTAMDGTYKDKVTPINDYYYIDSYKGEKIICDLCGGSYSGLDEVYFGNEITNIIGNKNVVLAVQTLKSDDTDLVEDTVIYGLELGSFKMVTPIWSRLQQRAIPIYTKEHANIMKRKTGCIGAPDDVTFYCEIFKTMNDLADNYLPVEEPTSDDYDINAMVDDTIVDEKGKVNKEFVKKFTITPVSNK